MGGMRAHDVGSSVSLTQRYHVASAHGRCTFPPNAREQFYRSGRVFSPASNPLHSSAQDGEVRIAKFFWQAAGIVSSAKLQTKRYASENDLFVFSLFCLMIQKTGNTGAEKLPGRTYPTMAWCLFPPLAAQRRFNEKL